MQKMSGYPSRSQLGRWSQLVLLVVLLTVLITTSLAPVPVTAQTANFCTSNDQCPSGQLCCPIGGPSNFKGCTLPFNGKCPPVV